MAQRTYIKVMPTIAVLQATYLRCDLLHLRITRLFQKLLNNDLSRITDQNLPPL